VLELSDEELIAAVAGRDVMEMGESYARFDSRQAQAARERAATAGVDLICQCDGAYPAVLHDLAAPPAVLHVVGGLTYLIELGEAVAIVGARTCTSYGRQVAGSLAGGVSSAGLSVVSGMALGIDSVAHRAALAADATPTVAVLPGPAERSYPAASRGLYQQIVSHGVVISELAPGTPVRRWSFLARNRIIAALATATVVVEASHGSGALVTARFARAVGRAVGAVPGPVTSPLSVGTNELLYRGETLIRGPQDVLDLIFGAGQRTARDDQRVRPAGDALAALEAIAAGAQTAEAVVRSGFQLSDLAALELGGWIRRGPGGQLTVIP
jgi:DNA processing protein